MTISDLCAVLNERQPVKPSHARRCAECGSEDFIWSEEHTGPYLDPDSWTGNDIEVCAECQTPTGRVERYGWAQ